MQHATHTFQSSDRLNIHTESWLPDGEPKAIVLIVHGYGEHIGRYAHVAERLVQHGYAVYGLDHRGHGKSEGLRAHFDHFDQPVNDLKQYFDQIKAQHPGQKIFLWAHSMGSLIGLAFALRYQDQLAGMVLSGTAVNGDETQPAPLIAVGKLLSNVIPKVALIPALPAAALSHDAAIVTGYDSDPLNYRGAWRVRMGSLLIEAGRQLRARASELRLPLLILHGGDDQLVPKSGSEYMYERAGSSDKTLKIYPGLYHEVHNELEKETVLADAVNWLDQHV
jgi:alpha-beta hydrolase superfamily lysophospholipase